MVLARYLTDEGEEELLGSLNGYARISHTKSQKHDESNYDKETTCKPVNSHCESHDFGIIFTVPQPVGQISQEVALSCRNTSLPATAQVP